MKIAELHDGKTIIFPPDMEDAAMDKMARSYAGVDDDAAKNALMAEAVAAVNGFAQGLLQAQAQMVAEMGQLRDLIKSLQESTVSNGAINQKASLLIYAGLEQMIKALIAPKEFIMDKDKKPIGFRVGK